MANGAREVRVWHRTVFDVEDQNQRHVAEAQVEWEQIGQILTTMERRNSASCDRPKKREMELIDMEVQDIEVVDPLADAIKHQHVVGDRIADADVKAECLGYAGTRLAAVIELPLANRVTSWPRPTSSSVR